jgi:ribosomal protein S18 acetylase RimI-like enzyme
MAGAPEQLVDDMPDLMARASVPGVSIAFVRDGRVAWSAGFGTTHRETGGAIGRETIFQAASLSKPVFAYAVLWMVHERVLDLDLDCSLADYLPERFVADDDMLEQVTARHVLAHTTGWPNWRPKGEPLRREAAPGVATGEFWPVAARMRDTPCVACDQRHCSDAMGGSTRTDVMSHGLQIEPARQADLDQLTALDARTFSRFDRFPRGDWAALLAESLAGGPARILVARHAEHATGAVVVLPDLGAKEVTIVSLAVDGPYRRTGLATRLLCDVLSTVAEQIENVILEVRVENSAARTLYEKLGFQITRTIRGYYGDGGTALEYSAPLALVLTRTCPRRH